MRINTPWIEAFRRREKEGHDPSKASGKPQIPPDRKLTPKHMSDSYHSLVGASSNEVLIHSHSLIDHTAWARSMAVGHIP